MNGEAGKGSVYRKVNFKVYDREHLRIFGIKCPICDGVGTTEWHDDSGVGRSTCSMCLGIGYLDRKRFVKCRKCRGCGRVQSSNHAAVTGPCQNCGGSGLVEKKRWFQVKSTS